MFRQTCIWSVLTLVFVSLASPTYGDGFERANNSVELLTDAAHNLVVSLDTSQQRKALFPLGDKEWFNVRLAPFGARGLKFKQLTQGQITLVHTVINAGFSASGYHKVASIIALEEYNEELSGRAERDDSAHGIGNFSISIFGTPEPGGSWAFRLHGHHLYLSLAVADGKLVSTGPSFFGGQPHEVTEGPRSGWHVLRDEENLGRDLYLSLSDVQRKKASIADKVPNDVFSGNNADIGSLASDEGVAFSELNAEQQEKLRSVVMEYAYDIPRDLAYSRLGKIERGGWEKIRFRWIGSTEKFEKMYYAVQGPEFLIEYCVTSLGKNHIHTVWREFDGDFGRDILAEHLKASPH